MNTLIENQPDDDDHDPQQAAFARESLLRAEHDAMLFVGRTIIDEIAVRFYDQCPQPFDENGSPTDEGLDAALAIAAEAVRELSEKPGAWLKHDVIDRIRREDGLLDPVV